MKTSFFYYWEVLWQMPQELWFLSFPIQLGVRTIWFPNEFRGKYRDIWRPIFSLPIKLPRLPKSPSVSNSSASLSTSTDSDSSSIEDEIIRHTTPPRIPQYQQRVSIERRTNDGSVSGSGRETRRKWSVYKYVQSWFFTEG